MVKYSTPEGHILVALNIDMYKVSIILRGKNLWQSLGIIGCQITTSPIFIIGFHNDVKLQKFFISLYIDILF